MVVHEALQEGRYDLAIGDEPLELDFFLHENPELKNTAYAWFTVFVGWLPMPDIGDRERALTADYNLGMIEQIERFPRLRDKAVFVGSAEDIVPDRFVEGLPGIREWTERHYDFSGYVTGFNPAEFADQEAVRHELSYGPNDAVCIVTVGGSAAARTCCAA